MYLNIIFLINAFASVFLMGLIWTIQLVHYPSFRFVDEANFKALHYFHGTRISILVIPVMIAELVTSAVLWWNNSGASLQAVGFYLVILIWLSTAIFSVPMHTRLNKGKDGKAISILINTNWIRTILWSLKALLSIYLLA